MLLNRRRILIGCVALLAICSLIAVCIVNRLRIGHKAERDALASFTLTRELILHADWSNVWGRISFASAAATTTNQLASRFSVFRGHQFSRSNLHHIKLSGELAYIHFIEGGNALGALIVMRRSGSNWLLTESVGYWETTLD